MKRYIPLPSSLAFDQQMLRMAEDDWLGHVLVALFQETTASFYDQVREFYRAVEERYDLPGLFHAWLRHTEYDLDHDHAGRLAAVLDTNEEIDRAQLTRSLRQAHFTFSFLLRALDDVLAEDRPDDAIVLRRPAEVLPVFDRSVAAGAPRAPELDRTFLRIDFAHTLLRCMSYAAQHDEVILFGRLCRRAEDAMSAAAPLPQSGEALAVGNFMREAATRPATSPFLLDRLAQLASLEASDDTWLPLAPEAREQLAAFLGRHRPEVSDRGLVTLAQQLDELYVAWLRRRGEARPVDLFRA